MSKSELSPNIKKYLEQYQIIADPKSEEIDKYCAEINITLEKMNDLRDKINEISIQKLQLEKLEKQLEKLEKSKSKNRIISSLMLTLFTSTAIGIAIFCPHIAISFIGINLTLNIITPIILAISALTTGFISFRNEVYYRLMEDNIRKNISELPKIINNLNYALDIFRKDHELQTEHLFELNEKIRNLPIKQQPASPSPDALKRV